MPYRIERTEHHYHDEPWTNSPRKGTVTRAVLPGTYATPEAANAQIASYAVHVPGASHVQHHSGLSFATINGSISHYVEFSRI